MGMLCEHAADRYGALLPFVFRHDCDGLFWIVVLGWATSFIPTTQEKEACYQSAAKTSRDTKECKTIWEHKHENLNHFCSALCPLAN
jgi:hypothetical protein